MFYVSRLEELIGSCDNIVTTKNLITFEEFTSKAHVQNKVLDVKTKQLRSKIVREFKIKWMDKFIKDVTWEWENTIKTNFPNFSL